MNKQEKRTDRSQKGGEGKHHKIEEEMSWSENRKATQHKSIFISTKNQVLRTSSQTPLVTYRWIADDEQGWMQVVEEVC